jgi:hypothetical protein
LNDLWQFELVQTAAKMNDVGRVQMAISLGHPWIPVEKKRGGKKVVAIKS